MAQSHHNSLHALLIGIDGYPPPLTPLGGCVNDIEAFEQLLRERLRPEGLEIRRLTAPAKDKVKKDLTGECLPTRDAILAELRRLDTELVGPGDRVLIYYSGHGSMDLIEGLGAYYEGLVPWDRQQAGLIYDCELNFLFQSIAERCGELTVILDCCHAAGAARHHEQRQLRYLPAQTVRALPEGALLRSAPSPLSMQTGLSIDGPREYSVLAACHADQSAAEMQPLEQHGKTHGIFTSCLLSVLAAEPTERLQALRFVDIWEPLKAAITRYSKNQDPWLLGPAARRLFGGPWVRAEPGLAVQQAGDGSYRIGGGTLAGIGRGSLLAVYGEEPPQLPIPETLHDLQVRLGTLEIAVAHLASSVAYPLPGQLPFHTPPGARGRRIGSPSRERLCVGLHKALPGWVTRALESRGATALFRIVDYDEESAEILVYPGGPEGWYIRDDASSLLDELVPPLDSALIRIPMAGDAQMLTALHAVLSHLAQYMVPIKLCRQLSAGATEAPVLKLLTCRDLDGHLLQVLDSDPRLCREASRGSTGRYLLRHGEPVCILLTNHAQRHLFVTLLVCNMEGQVQVLETNTFIPASSGHLFWAGSAQGVPFLFGCPYGRSQGVDRIIVVATEQRGIDLSALAHERTLQQTLTEATASRNVFWLDTPKSAPPFCVSAQTLVEITRGS